MTPSRSVALIAVSAFSTTCVVTHHPVFAAMGFVLMFVALAGRSDQ